jgi:hypothetical protein
VPRRKTLVDKQRGPTHVSVDDLLRVLADSGWQVRPGTLHGTIAERAGRTILVPRAHGKHPLPVYVRRAIKVIEEVK